ncbi:MAG: hypothetical protein H6695_08855 [Deferribacteres bacterium]|nr:hypothetical protein [candidate division KSB1 bacterium]MCB9510278.1 hypothetical protein [Deferribacteres bacterium]
MGKRLLHISGNWVRKTARRISGLTALAFLLCTLSCSNKTMLAENRPIQQEGLNVLFIGNSLTYFNDMPDMLQRMLDYAGVEIGLIEVIAYPNYGLQDHWLTASTRERIATPGWDVVVLQQGPSATEGRPSLLEYSKLFASLTDSSDTRMALYMVWPAQERSFDFDGVSASYRMAAEQVDGLLFPAGEAWRAAWSKDSTLVLYASDNFHPNRLGSHLTALVMFQQLARRDPHDLPAKIMTANGDIEISEDLAKLLQDAATEANARFAR